MNPEMQLRTGILSTPKWTTKQMTNELVQP